MEDVIQRIFAILLAVLIFFMFPLYVAFEKKDDIAYALALKVTTKFVDQITDTGYLTMEMYDKYLGELSTTGNVYDITLEYTAKQYSPVIQVYKENSNNEIELIKEYDYLEKKDDFEEYDKNNNKKDIFNDFLTMSNADFNKLKAQITYKLSERKFSTDQILKFLNGEDNNFVSSTEYNSKSVNQLPVTARIYGLSNEGLITMNTGDQFTITVRNTNTTIASMLFNTLTFGANSGNDTKVYINYGGTIKNQEYKISKRGDINQDAIVDDRDQQMIDNYLNDPKSLTTIQKIIADVDRNGIIEEADKAELLRVR